MPTAKTTKVKELIKAGNVKRIIIKSKEGKTLVEVPLTITVESEEKI